MSERILLSENLNELFCSLKEIFKDLTWFVLVTPTSVIVCSGSEHLVKKIVDNEHVLDFSKLSEINLMELNLKLQKQTPILPVLPSVFTESDVWNDIYATSQLIMSPYYWGELNKPLMPTNGFNLFSHPILSKELCELKESFDITL